LYVREERFLIKIIAEMSGNHNGSLDRALEIVSAVAASGARYVKLQTYTADTITLPVDGGLFQVSDDHPLWGGKSLYSLYQNAYTPWEWHEPLFKHARSLGLIPFSTPFDETAVDFLEGLNVELYKIASLEIVDLPLIEMVARTGKPMIISTGTATLAEISEAVEAARRGGCQSITLLLCTSSYPAKAEDSNLSRLGLLSKLFDVEVGFSDHTLGISNSVAAVALGARVIEKHFTLKRSDGGVDSAFSIEPHELRQLVDAASEVELAIGRPDQWSTQAEAESLRHRPSLYVTKNVSAGEAITSENVRSVRPSGGLQPKFIGLVIGKSFTRDAKMGDPVSWDLVG
jgi:pseudaminic acid synthase